MQQSYAMTIQNLFTIDEGVLSGGVAEIAILDGSLEVDRVKLSGKVGPGESVYRREYIGKPGLRAELLTEVGQITFTAI
ncbi:hypothetical protein [Pseudomonas atacamensis]|jgi:hypothetical protein|uniref:hypothetical protein n=1 Tax=Pseudomonas atacamensis TaxID=2565368 RepID=UPI0019D283B5|nr:hypothetical protein [Pseudomonas atacamensis]QSL85925.1 hypothetical protein JWU58_17260 [Pseudomonas atacamensis]